MERKKEVKSRYEEVFGPRLEREEVLKQIESDRETYVQFMDLSKEFREELLEFCMGVRGIKMTYDPFFKYIFNPMTHPERLESVIGLCLRQKVKLVEVIPNESVRIVEEGSLMVMDIVVRLESGDLVNVEIQRFGYMFPGARCACYSCDLMMRQYSSVRARARDEERRFSYRDIKKVYMIVIMQKSPKEFHEHPKEYRHYARQVFDTGLEFDMLQEYVLIPLDIFLKIPHNELTRLDAWLYFIASDRMEDIKRVVEAYPEFKQLYQEVFRFRYHVKELTGMFSEALRILDVNTTQYMIEEQKKEIEEQKKEIEERNKEIEEQNKKLEERKGKIEEQKREIEKQKKELEELKQKQNEANQLRAENERLKALLAQKNA